jgi:hypothetical protein
MPVNTTSLKAHFTAEKQSSAAWMSCEAKRQVAEQALDIQILKNLNSKTW